MLKGIKKWFKGREKAMSLIGKILSMLSLLLGPFFLLPVPLRKVLGK